MNFIFIGSYPSHAISFSDGFRYLSKIKNEKIKKKNEKKSETHRFSAFYFFFLVYCISIMLNFISSSLYVIFHLSISKPVPFGYCFSEIVVGRCLRIAATKPSYFIFCINISFLLKFSLLDKNK